MVGTGGFARFENLARTTQKGQETPECYYDIERIHKHIIAGDGEMLLCSIGSDARNATEEDVIDGDGRSAIAELAEAKNAADKALIFSEPR